MFDYEIEQDIGKSVHSKVSQIEDDWQSISLTGGLTARLGSHDQARVFHGVDLLFFLLLF